MSAPLWLTELAQRADGPEGVVPWRRQLAPTGEPGQRQSAVLILFSGTTGQVNGGMARGHGAASAAPAGTPPAAVPPSDISILLTERAHTMRSHPGQVSFPGGRAEPDDADLAATALREANEEVGVEPDSVAVAGVLSPLNLAVSSHDVSPVLGWWERPGRAWVRQPAEVARVLQVPVADLVDPAHRFRVGHPSGWIGPAFEADGLLVWGFTALLLDGVLRLGGWEREWDESDVRPLP